jgi:uncharacterized BrkB/YihY/UPF0761 family membrane protein
MNPSVRTGKAADDEAGHEPADRPRRNPLGWVARTRDIVMEVAPRAPGYDRARGAIDRDRRFGGGLLAGALAFRLFGAMLPLALLICVLVGYADSVDAEATRSVEEVTGVGGALLNSVAESSKLSSGTRWSVTLAAAVALLWSAILAAKSIRAVHSLAWDGGIGRLERPVAAGLVLLAAIAALAGLVAAGGRAHEVLGPGGSLIVVLGVFAGFFGIWLGLSWLLPHGGSPWTALIPGAVLFAVSVQFVHLFTSLFIAGKVERASDTYGALGVAFTILFWLYVVSRIIVASAMLNSSLENDRRRSAAARTT